MYSLIRCYFHNIIFLVNFKFRLGSGKVVHHNEHFDFFQFFFFRYNCDHCFHIDVRALFYLHKTIANLTSSFQKSYTALQSSVHWVVQIVRNNVMFSTPFIFPIFCTKKPRYSTRRMVRWEKYFCVILKKKKVERIFAPFAIRSETSCYTIQSVISIGISFPFIQYDFINSP